MKNSLFSSKSVSKRTVKLSLIGVFFASIILLLVSCTPELPTVVPTLPVVSTTDVTNVTTTSATLGGNVSSEGDASVQERGICWGLSSNPTVSDNKLTNGVGLGSFTGTINGLTAGTNYHARAYAKNSVGTGYGIDVSFMTIAIMYPVTIISGANGTATAPKEVAHGTSFEVKATPSIGFMTDSISVNGLKFYLNGTNSYTIMNSLKPPVVYVTFKVDVMWMLTQKPWKTTMEQKRLLGTTSWTNFYPPQVPIHTFVFNNTYKMQEYDQNNKLIGDVNYTLKQDSLISGATTENNGIRNKIILLSQDSLILRSVSKFYIHFPDIRDPSRDIEIQETLKH